MSDFKEIRPAEITGNVFDLIGRQWMLITAGDKSSGYNTMTANWGGLGVLWNGPVAFCFVRPQRHTFKFIERNDCFSLSFYDDKYRSALEFCGTKSGRDYDKAKETGLTPVFGDEAVYFGEAKLVLICKKLYTGTFDPSKFLEQDIESNYPAKDYHKAYIGAVKKVLTK